MTTRTVVVGGGIMGAGIAYEARVAGFPVTIVESNSELLEAAKGRVAHYGREPGRRVPSSPASAPSSSARISPVLPRTRT